MPWPVCNTTLEDERINETSLFESHDFTFHQLGVFLCAISTVIAILVSFFLMYMHCVHYSRPNEQRHIIRILFMVPVYAAVSLLSYYYYLHSIYFEVIRDCYEAFAIAAFFSLLCAYIAEDLHEQKEYFRSIKPKRWIWPMKYFQKCTGGNDKGWLRTPRSGLTWFNVIWLCVFQYCFIRVAMTVVSVITQYFKRYCIESLNPAFSHVWVMVIEAVAVTIAMFCLIQFYIQIGGDIRQHKPLLKVAAIKLVIFLSFWQSILISFLTSSGAIKASPRIQAPDLKIGIPSMLLCLEMSLFAVFHLWAFSYKPYVIGSPAYEAAWGVGNVSGKHSSQPPQYHGGFLGWRAMVNCFNPWDMIKAIARAGRWLFVGRRRRMEDVSYRNVNDGNIVESQKLDDLSSTSTAYPGPGGHFGSSLPPKSKLPPGEEGQTLLTAAQANPMYNPPSPGMGESPWTEVESKEYFQEQQMRRQDPNFRTQAPSYTAYNPSGDIGLAQTVPGHQQYTSQDAMPGRTQSVNRPPSSRLNFSRPTTAQYEVPTGAAVPTTIPETSIPYNSHQQQPKPFVTLQDIRPQETGVTSNRPRPYGNEMQGGAEMPNFPSQGSNDTRRF